MLSLSFSYCCSPRGVAKMGDMSAAVKSFTKALELAEMLKDEPSQEAIKKALQDISSPAVQVVQEDSKGH